MTGSSPALGGLMTTCAVTPTVTDVLIGMAAAAGLNYAEAFARPENACWMQQLDDPVVMPGPLLRPIRGVIFAPALSPVRDSIFSRAHRITAGGMD